MDEKVDVMPAKKATTSRKRKSAGKVATKVRTKRSTANAAEAEAEHDLDEFLHGEAVKYASQLSAKIVSLPLGPDGKRLKKQWPAALPFWFGAHLTSRIRRELEANLRYHVAESSAERRSHATKASSEAANVEAWRRRDLAHRCRELATYATQMAGALDADDRTFDFYALPSYRYEGSFSGPHSFSIANLDPDAGTIRQQLRGRKWPLREIDAWLRYCEAGSATRAENRRDDVLAELYFCARYGTAFLSENVDLPVGLSAALASELSGVSGVHGIDVRIHVSALPKSTRRFHFVGALAHVCVSRVCARFPMAELTPDAVEIVRRALDVMLDKGERSRAAAEHTSDVIAAFGFDPPPKPGTGDDAAKRKQVGKSAEQVRNRAAKRAKILEELETAKDRLTRGPTKGSR